MAHPGDQSQEGMGMKRAADQEDYNSNVKRAREGEGPSTTIRILLQSKDAGGIIGKGGQNIKRLRSEYNATVNVPDTNTSERILTLVGPRGTVLTLLSECLTKIGESGPALKGPHNEQTHPPGEKEVQLLVQQSQAGSIIGRAGYKIKEIREQHGANVKVFSDCLPNSTERVVAIGGSDEVTISTIEKILYTLDEAPLKGMVTLYDPSKTADVFDEWEYNAGFGSPMGRGGPRGGPRGGGMRGGGMRGGPRGGPRGGFGGRGSGMGGQGGRGGGRGVPFNAGGNFEGNMNMGGANFQQDFTGGNPGDGSEHGGMNQGWAEEAETSTQVTIPSDLAGAIIGKGGERIRNIRQRSQAVIKIDDPLPNSPDRIITISGTQSRINHAQFLMQQSVRQYSGKNF